MNVKVIGLMVAALSPAGACSDGGGSDSVVGDVVSADAGWADAGPQRCKKVDLVFAMDASGTMKEEIEAMSVDVFPRLADALRDIGGGLEDYRIGFIDACPMPASFHTRGGSVTDCGFQSGEVWMDSTSTALNDEFACVSDIYDDDIADFPGGCTGDNDDEQPIGATVAALSPPWSEGKNAGFVRDDALLVVVAITDEDEQPAPRATPEELYERLIAIKGGVDKMVFLGIGGASECIDPPGLYGQARESRRLKAVTELFEQHDRGVFWDLCGGRLEDGLTEAMSVIEASCRRVD